MSDSLTIGAVTSLVLSMASEAALKSVVGEAVKDTYKSLKRKIGHWALSDVEALEHDPSSAQHRAAIAEAIDALPSDDRESIKILAKKLVNALEDSVTQAPIGLDVSRLGAARIKLEGIEVHKGIGLRAQTITTHGDFELKDVTVGDVRGKVTQ